MTNLVPIGRFSQITQLSIKALRHYAEEGLLYPTYVDPDSNYRYYSLEQARMAARIRMLRELEMPLEDVRAVLYAETPSDLKCLLIRHQERITRRIEQYQHALSLLNRLIEGEENLTFNTIRIKEVVSQPIVSIRMRTCPASFGQIIPSIMCELTQFARRRGLRRLELPRISIYYEYNEEIADVEIALPVERVVAREGHIMSRVIEGGLVAYLMHVGPYEHLGTIYPTMAAWIQEHGHETNGHPREVFWVGPREVDDPEQYRTEILWPIS